MRQYLWLTRGTHLLLLLSLNSGRRRTLLLRPRLHLQPRHLLWAPPSLPQLPPPQQHLQQRLRLSEGVRMMRTCPPRVGRAAGIFPYRRACCWPPQLPAMEGEAAALMMPPRVKTKRMMK